MKEPSESMTEREITTKRVAESMGSPCGPILGAAAAAREIADTTREAIRRVDDMRAPGTR